MRRIVAGLPLLEGVRPVVVVVGVKSEPVGPHPRHMSGHGSAHPLQHGGLLLLLLLLGLAERLPETVATHGYGRKLLAGPPALGEIVRMTVVQRWRQAAETAAKFRGGPQPDVVRWEREAAGMERTAIGKALQAAGGRC